MAKAALLAAEIYDRFWAALAGFMPDHLYHFIPIFRSIVYGKEQIGNTID